MRVPNVKDHQSLFRLGVAVMDGEMVPVSAVEAIKMKHHAHWRVGKSGWPAQRRFFRQLGQMVSHTVGQLRQRFKECPQPRPCFFRVDQLPHERRPVRQTQPRDCGLAPWRPPPDLARKQAGPARGSAGHGKSRAAPRGRFLRRRFPMLGSLPCVQPGLLCVRALAQTVRGNIAVGVPEPLQIGPLLRRQATRGPKYGGIDAQLAE